MTECRSVTLSRLRRGDRGNLLGRAKHYLKHVAPVRPARANCKVLGLSSSNLQNCAASWIDATKGGELLHVYCCCLAIPSMLTAERKCPHDGACEIDAARTGKTSGTQQLTGWIYDDGAGSDTDGTERTPYQAHTGGIQGEGSSRNSSRQQRSQPCQCYSEHTGDRSSTSGSDQIRRSQPHAPERVAEGARGYRHRSRHVTQDTD